jgi:hypothetical protein
LGEVSLASICCNTTNSDGTTATVSSVEVADDFDALGYECLREKKHLGIKEAAQLVCAA